VIDAVTVTPLCQRMIEDMTIRRFGEHTQRDYVRQVREFTAFLGLPPDRAEPEELRRYQLHLASLGASYARMNLASTALRFFFQVTLGRTGFGDRVARIPTPERLPVVLSTQEVALLLAHAPNLKYRAALSVAYGCGLRVSEIANADPGRAGQEPQGPLCHARARSARSPAAVVAGEAAARLALPRPAAGTAPGRSFLPWRLSDAGSQPRPNPPARAGIQNPSQLRTIGHRR